MLVNVFRDDDAIVHQNADDEDHLKEGNHVDGHPHVARNRNIPMNDTGIAKATQFKRMLRNSAKNNTTRMNSMMPLFTNKSSAG